MRVARLRALYFCFGPGKFVHDTAICTALVYNVVLQSCCGWYTFLIKKMLLRCFDCELNNASAYIIILGVCRSQVLDLQCQEVEPWRISFLISFPFLIQIQMCVVFTDLQSIVLVKILNFWLVIEIESSFQKMHSDRVGLRLCLFGHTEVILENRKCFVANNWLIHSVDPVSVL